METSFQNKMYNYEVTPPQDVFENVFNRLDDEKVKPFGGKITLLQHFSTNLVAACLILFIIAIVFLDLHPRKAENIVSERYAIVDDSPALVQSNAPILKRNYITVIGPQGKVKVSRKVAEIFVAPETPSKAQWNKKLEHWKNIMMTASNTDFMDVIPITETAEVEN